MRTVSTAFLLAAFAWGCAGERQVAASHFEKAADLVQGGDWEGSLAEYEHGCTVVSDSAEREACRTKERSLYEGHQHRVADVAAAPAASAPTTPTSQVATSTDDALLSGAPQPNAYAVIVGVEHYEGLPAPTGARRDAERTARMAKYTLGVSDAHVHVDLDQHATKGAVLRDVEWARSNVPKNGRIYFYFSGHGAPDAASGSAYIVPSDGDPKYLNETTIAVSDLVAKLSSSPAKDALVFIDSCFSGAGGRSVLPAGARPLLRVHDPKLPATVALFTAASGSEISGPSSDGQSGLFSAYLIEALGKGMADANGDGEISLGELRDWVSPRVTRDARKDGRAQSPKLVVGGGLGAATDLLVAWGMPAR